jgi:uncharacterized repeat protein (TIGR03803 family)
VKNRCHRFVSSFLIGPLICAFLLLSPMAHAVTYRAYSLTGGTQGNYPIWSGSLIRDSKGNFYGTTFEGGEHSGGAAFEISISDGGPKFTVLYSFPGAEGDGSQPDSSLVFDASGNLYGTTVQGGTRNDGTIYELSPNSNGTWTENVLYSFQGLGDGSYPTSPLAIDASGTLYGTTSNGGNDGFGAVFTLSRSGNTWSKNMIYSFSGPDGEQPNAVTLDAAGSVYGTTLSGGTDNVGTVFELSQSGGVWTESALYSFTYSTGEYPYAGVTLDAAGNLYGTTNYGGSGTDCSPGTCGAVYELQNANGMWTESILYSFLGGEDGSFPYAGVTLDAAGNLYGTTAFGGGGSCSINSIPGCGTIFRLHRSGKQWAESVFRFNGKDGANPQAGVILDKKGDVFGTTLYGGSGSCQGNLPGCGVVFELTP